MQDTTSQPDRFKPEMPRIPGVNEPPRKSHARSLIAATAIGLIVIFGWGVLHIARSSRTNAQASADTSASRPLPAVASDQFSADIVPQQGPMPVATLAELASPWSAKKFTFVNLLTREEVPAMIVRLPGSSGDRSTAYWAFSMNAPYESCQLEYVTDLGELASRYSYHASHPMVLAACDGIIYDPLRVGTAPSGAWVRGEIVHGVGIRPPLAIEIHVQGNMIVANSME